MPEVSSPACPAKVDRGCPCWTAIAAAAFWLFGGELFLSIFQVLKFLDTWIWQWGPSISSVASRCIVLTISYNLRMVFTYCSLPITYTSYSYSVYTIYVLPYWLARLVTEESIWRPTAAVLCQATAPPTVPPAPRAPPTMSPCWKQCFSTWWNMMKWWNHQVKNPILNDLERLTSGLSLTCSEPINDIERETLVPRLDADVVANAAQKREVEAAPAPVASIKRDEASSWHESHIWIHLNAWRLW